MNYFNELDCVNTEIVTLRRHIAYLANSMDDTALLNEKYLSDAKGKLDSEYARLNASATKSVIREELDNLKKQAIKLNDYREEIIKKIMVASRFSVKEIIDLMDKFESYHRTERVGNRTFIVPQDFYLMRSGYNSVIEEEDLRKLLAQYNYDEKAKKSAYSMQMYVKTPNGIEENKQILTAVAGLEIYDLEGVQVYQREGNDIVLNGKVVNLFPYDVLAFIDYMIIHRLDNPKITLDEAWKEYKGMNQKVLSFSEDDPALEDTYRKTR